jgi:hypothetical protein
VYRDHKFQTNFPFSINFWSFAQAAVLGGVPYELPLLGAAFTNDAAESKNSSAVSAFVCVQN